MQIYIYENFLIISELFTLIMFLYIFCLQLTPYGGIKVKTNAYTFTYSIGLLTLITIIVQFILMSTKLNISWSIFNLCIELTTVTNYFLYLFIISVILCLIFIIKINVIQFQQILKFEIYYLIVLCITGGSFILLSNDLLLLFLALELYNFGLYSIIGLQQNRVINTEISIKYYLISALSSSFIIFGISLIYGFSGLLNFNELSLFLINSTQFNYPLIIGIVFIFIGIFVKLGAAPFHFWTPDIYEGASNIINVILLTLPKIILICLLFKLMCSTFIFFSYINTIFAYIIILSSFYFGTFGAINQVKIKKFLTYSGISNMGFMFVTFLVLTQFSIVSLLIYVFIYIIHVFISLTLPLTKLLNFAYNKNKSLLNSITNLVLINKPLTYLIAINFFSLAGLPPLGGFFAKFYIFVALFEVNAFTVIFLFIIISCFSAFYYIKIIQILLFVPKVKPIFLKILPFSYCLVLTILSYIILGFVFINHILVELDLISFLN